MLGLTIWQRRGRAFDLQSCVSMFLPTLIFLSQQERTRREHEAAEFERTRAEREQREREETKRARQIEEERKRMDEIAAEARRREEEAKV